MTTLEQAAEKLDFKRILPLLVIVLVDLTGLSIIIPLMPLFAARFGATPLIIGILQATYPMMQFIGAPVLGRLSDRFGRKPVLIASQMGTLAGFVLLGFANTLWLLFISRIIDGLSGANISTAQAAIADSTNEKTRTQGLGLIGAAFGVGFVLGPIIAYAVLALSGGEYRTVALTAAFFSLTSILLTTFWFHETHQEDSPSISSLKSPFRFTAMFDALRRPAVGFLLLIMFFYQVAFGGYEQLFSLFTLTRLGMDATDTSGLFALAGVFIVIVQGGLIGRWSRKRGDRWLVILGVSTLAIGLIAGVVCFWSATWLKHKMGYDDSLDAFGVHCIGGIVGALLTGVFAVKDIGGADGSVILQAKGVLTTLVYSGVISFILLKIIDATIGLRVTEEEEREGLDVILHGEHVE